MSQQMGHNTLIALLSKQPYICSFCTYILTLGQSLLALQYHAVLVQNSMILSPFKKKHSVSVHFPFTAMSHHECAKYTYN